MKWHIQSSAVPAWVGQFRDVTIGIAEFQADETLELLVNRADQALIGGKRIEKNTCYYAAAPAMLLRQAS